MSDCSEALVSKFDKESVTNSDKTVSTQKNDKRVTLTASVIKTGKKTPNVGEQRRNQITGNNPGKSLSLTQKARKNRENNS